MAKKSNAKKTNYESKSKSKKSNASSRSTRGATRRKSRGESRDWGAFFPALVKGVVGVSLVATLLAVALLWLPQLELRDKVGKWVNRPIAHVGIEGEFVHLSKRQVQQMLLHSLEGNFFTVDLEALKMKIEREPWVGRVSLQRKWPDGLKVRIEELKPIARWGDQGFVDQYGKVVFVESNAALKSLPRLEGPVEISQEITRQYLQMSEFLSRSELKVAGIQVDDKLSWTLNIAESFDVVLGQGEILEKLKNFTFAYSTRLKRDQASIARVDMRYTNALAVRWKAEYAKTLLTSRQ